MINKAGKELTWLFALKILSRLFDLTLNILVLRDLEPGIYGMFIHWYLEDSQLIWIYWQTSLSSI